MESGLAAHRVESLRELWDDGPDRDGNDTDGGVCLAEHDGEPAWYARTPNGLVANLHAHTVTENDDGTITVAETIVVGNALGVWWRGTLVDGVWRELGDDAEV